MPIILLTDRTLAGLAPAPGAERTDYFDRTLPGFGVRVGPHRKTFVVMYRTQRTRRFRRQTLGQYPQLSLATAREKARLVLRKANVGRDPATEQQTARAQTFGALAALYLEKHAKRKKRSWRDDARMIRHEFAAWIDRPVVSIRRAEVRDLLDAIVDRGAPILANRVLALVRKMLNFGLDREWVEANVAAKMPAPSKERSRSRVLSPEEIRALWTWLERPAPAPVNETHWRLSQAVFKLRLLTLQRGMEILSLKWADLDVETRWWTIPGEHTKNGLAHRVFLAAPTLKILKGLRDVAPPTDGFVFRGILGARHRRAVLVKLPLDDFQPKDLRRTASSYMTAGGVARDTVKKVLNHVEREVTAVYDRYSYDPEKQAALTWWAVKLEAILKGKGTKVIPFAR
jgi:integrase